MKRKYVHSGFAAVTLGLGIFIGSQWLVVDAAKSLTDAIDQIPHALTQASDDGALAAYLDYPESQLAYANALSAADRFEEAEAAFDALIQRHGFDPIGQAAQFNLANAYLRQGLASDLPSSQAAPMFELAKQRYRDLLRISSGDWDLRYNLERALQLAPEHAALLDHDKADIIRRIRIIVPDEKAKDLP